MPYNTHAYNADQSTPAGAAPYGSQYEPVVSCSLIEPDGVTRHTEYTSVPWAPDQNHQPGTTGTAQLEIETQLSNVSGATYTIKCSVTSDALSTDPNLGVADLSATADLVSPL
jgi:hypothetical protein